jgi:hypothetical protein
MKTLCSFLVVIIFLFAANVCRAQEGPMQQAEPPKEDAQPAQPAVEEQKAPAPATETTERREIEGKVSAVNSHFIAVECGVDVSNTYMIEMAFNIDKGVQIAHKKSIKDIGQGDIVKILYDEVTKTENNIKSAKRVARVVTFLKGSEKKKQLEGKLKSGSENDAIPLKGLKGE